jgi:hypothetical protein
MTQRVATNRQLLERFLSDVLLADNLLVLCGLGSARAALGPTGQPLAPSMADLWQAAAETAGADFHTICTEARFPQPASDPNIEALLSACHLAHAFSPSPLLATFIAQTEALIVAKCRFVTNEADLSTHATFLRKVARRPTRQPRLKLFTTNYDTCFEKAATLINFLVVDGFSHSTPQEFDGGYFEYDFVRREADKEAPDYIPNVFHLYKLHGSVDWETSDRRIRRNANAFNPLIIYPEYSKFELSYSQPFLEMMARFQLGLRRPNTGLVIVGCGFSDSHIAEPVLAAVRSNVGLRCLIVDPGSERSTNRYVTEFGHLAKAGDHRLGLFCGTFEEFVPFIPDLVADTEAERHVRRLAEARGIR